MKLPSKGVTPRTGSFGAMRELPSGRWQASYIGPDKVRHTAPATFAVKTDAEEWLVGERRLVERPGEWSPPKSRSTQSKVRQDPPETQGRPVKAAKAAKVAGKRRRASFGTTRKLPSGRWQASYIGLDLARHYALVTFMSREDAQAWCTSERRLIDLGVWSPPKSRATQTRGQSQTLAEFWATWPESRDWPLKPKTLHEYQKLWRIHIAPTFGDVPLAHITRESVVAWHRGFKTHPTAQSRAYGLLHAILASAVDRNLISENPARIKGASQVKPEREIRPATLNELVIIIGHLQDPKLKMLVIVTTWCALRYGEAIELRRMDVDLDAGILRVERAAQYLERRWLVDRPKADSGRSVELPPHLIPGLRRYMDEHIAAKPDALLFPSSRDPDHHLHRNATNRFFKPACAAAGRPDLTLHVLRHTGGTFAAQTGATQADVMGRLGHVSPQAFMRYQHSTSLGRKELAAGLPKPPELP